MSLSKKLNDQQRIEFAKDIELLFESAHASWPKLLSLAFLKGMVTGLGVFVGGTIVVGLLLWILSGLGHIPFLSQITDSAQQTLEDSKP